MSECRDLENMSRAFGFRSPRQDLEGSLRPPCTSKIFGNVIFVTATFSQPVL